jgi:replication factor C large subunit
MGYQPAIESPNSSSIWSDKYSPRKVSEVLGNGDAIARIKRWLLAWDSGKPPEKRAILLSGPTGTGKTAMVYAIGNESGHEVVEVNASDKRDKETIRRVIGSTAALGSLFNDVKTRILLFDEVDGLSGDEDRGGVSAIIEVIKETTNPIILTANDKWDSKIRPLQRLCMMVDLRRIQTSTIVNMLIRICQNEGVKSNLEALRVIADNSGGDLRSAINDLQAIAEGRNEITLSDVKSLSSRRDRLQGIFDGLRAMFQAETMGKAISSIESLDIDYEMLIQWIYENIPREFPDPSELTRAFDALSRADIFLGRIKRYQDWGLLSYVFQLMSAGVALARGIPSKRFVNYSFPNYIRELSNTRSKRNAMKEVCVKFKVRCHASTNEVLHEFLPYVQTIIENNPRSATNIAKWFGLTEEDLETITGGKKVRLIKPEQPKPLAQKSPRTKEKGKEGKQTQLF